MKCGIKTCHTRIAAALLLACGTSMAQAENCSGTDVLVWQSVETTEVGPNHSLTLLKGYSIIVSPDSIYHNTSGECSGTVLATPDGKVQSMGYCARRDKDGDTSSISFHQAPGASKGVWKSTGGSGKFAGKNNSGWFQADLADGMMATSVWGGNCQ